MRFFTGLLLLLLFLGRANASPLLDQASNEVVNATNIAQCFNYHTECNRQLMSYIYFFKPTSPNVTLSISTDWRIRYPKDLEEVLVKRGYKMTTPHTTNCGWTIVSKVSKVVELGGIRFKQTEGLDATTFYLPEEKTVMEVEDLLKSTFPKVDIAIMVVLSTYMSWCTVVFILNFDVVALRNRIQIKMKAYKGKKERKDCTASSSPLVVSKDLKLV